MKTTGVRNDLVTLGRSVKLGEFDCCFVRFGSRVAGKPQVWGTLGLASDPFFAGRSKPFVTVGIVSDADLQEGLSRLRLSGSFRILFWRKV